MFASLETRQRRRFIKNSIENTRSELATNPLIHRRLGAYATYLTQLCGRLFIPDIQDGEVILSPKQQKSNGIPVIALRPGEPGVQLGQSFGYLYPIQRQHIQDKLHAWGLKNAAGTYMDTVQTALRTLIMDRPHYEPNYFTPEEGAGASVARPLRKINLDPAIFTTDVGPTKSVMLRPLMSLRYEGKDTPLTPCATLAHEGTHVLQVERDMFLTRDPSPEAQDEEMLAFELEAYHNGAGALTAQIEAGTLRSALTDYDFSQIFVEARRREINPVHNPYDPNDNIKNALIAGGIALHYPSE